MRNQAFVPVLVLVCAAAAVGVGAQSSTFDAERGRLGQEAVKARAAKGLDLLDPVLDKLYPYAEFQPVRIQKMMAGGSITVNLTGAIPPGSTILSDRDAAVLSGVTQTAKSYSARIAVGPGEGPGFVRLWSFTPVHHVWTVVPVAFIDTIYRFDLKSANGITVKLVPTDKTFNVTDREARLNYQADFYKGDDPKPFETRAADIFFMTSEDPRTMIDIGMKEADASPEKELQAIGEQLSDSSITEAQRQKLMQQMAVLQQRMIENMLKNAQADPAIAQKKIDDFGCRRLQVYPEAGTAVKATMLCGKNFNNGVLELAGTMTMMK
jgi:hypothetical protein